MLRLQQGMADGAVVAGQHLLAQHETGVGAVQSARQIGQQLQVLRGTEQTVFGRQRAITQASTLEQGRRRQLAAMRVVEHQCRLMARRNAGLARRCPQHGRQGQAAAALGATGGVSTARLNSASTTSGTPSASEQAWRKLRRMTRLSWAWWSIWPTMAHRWRAARAASSRDTPGISTAKRSPA